MLIEIKKQLHECSRYIMRMVRVRGSFEVGFLNRICDLLLCEDMASQKQDFTWQDSVSSNNNTANSPKYQSTKIDFAQVINQLLNIPTPNKSVTTETKIADNLNNNNNKQFREYQLLMIVDSLIFNLYGRSKKRDKLRLNNSFFNSSASVMSMSQMSDHMSEVNSHSMIGNNNNCCGDNDLLKVALGYVQVLVISDVFYKRLKVFYQRQSANKQQNHHYLENLLQTLEYILNKEKLSATKQHFIKQKNMQFKTFLHSSIPITFVPNNNQHVLQMINNVLFTNQLDKVITLISSAENNNNNLNDQQRLLFSINRVYFVARRAQTRKHFRSIKYSAEDMFFNLTKLYIHSFNTKLSMLQQSRNPIFLLLKSHLIMFYLPVFKKFTDLVQELTRYCQSQSGMIAFYQQNEEMLEKVLGQFIGELPLELIEFLSMLYKLVESQPRGGLVYTSSTSSTMSKPQSHQFNQSQTSSQHLIQQQHPQQQKSLQTVSGMVPVKRFLIYSFLCDPQLIKQHVLSQINNTNSNNTNNTKSNNPNIISKITFSLQQYQQVCNYIINLFFTSSVKKYTTYYSPQQLSSLVQLSSSIQRRLQQRIVSYSLQTREFYYDEDLPSSSLMEGYFIEEPILNYDYFILQNAIGRIEFTPKDNRRYQIVSYSNILMNAPNITNNNNLQLIDHSNNTTNLQPHYRFKLSGRERQNNNNNSSNELLFIKDKQGGQLLFHRNHKRELTLSPNNNKLATQNNAQLQHKFSLNQEKQSLNVTLTHQQSNIHSRGYLTTPGFFSNVGEQSPYLGNDYHTNEIDLLTWMTIGGSHNYKQKVSARKIKLSKTVNLQNKANSLQKKTKTQNISQMMTLNLENIKLNRIDLNQNQSEKLFFHMKNKLNNTDDDNYVEQQMIIKRDNKNEITNNKKKKLQFKTFNKQKVKEINRLYEQYASRNVYV